MRGIVNYEIGTGRAHDEDGTGLELQFCFAIEDGETQDDFALVNGILHRCRDFGLFGNLLSFWVRPEENRERFKVEVVLTAQDAGGANHG
ncbi:MAG: hypothetical protein ACK5PB_22280 [Pirellula sp.]|jgi:hypothetical protein